jgi:hypothetical protein
MGSALAKLEGQLDAELGSCEALRTKVAGLQEQLLAAQAAATTTASERPELQQARQQMGGLRGRVRAAGSARPPQHPSVAWSPHHVPPISRALSRSPPLLRAAHAAYVLGWSHKRAQVIQERLPLRAEGWAIQGVVCGGLSRHRSRRTMQMLVWSVFS